MKITIIGTGYVGLTSAVCLASKGHDVVCVDKDPIKISKLEQKIPTIYEKGLSELLERAVDSKKITFTTNLEFGIKNSKVIILAVGTPQSEDSGEADLSYIFQACNESSKFVTSPKLLITKSTVPLGTNFRIKEIIEAKSGIKIEVASNPEFMREGFAIDDFLKPDRIVIGLEEPLKESHARNLCLELYAPWIKENYPILMTDISTAELIKYASNAFLMTKVAFINEVANLCEKTGANIKDLSFGVGLDKRIGQKFLNPGPGIGGSCFPKDSLALQHIAKEAGSELSVLSQVIKANNQRFTDIANKITVFCKNNQNQSQEIAILGLAFKAGTDDVRMSPSIEIIKILLQRNFIIHAYDPHGMENSKKILGDKIHYHQTLIECYNHAKDIVILTEWDEFKNIKNFADFNDKNVMDMRFFLTE